MLYLVEHGEENCSGFTSLASKTNLSYHLARLREAGVTRTRIEGPSGRSRCGATTSTPAFRAC
jgi:DNA-binding transcriptional ArsR family regulator